MQFFSIDESKRLIWDTNSDTEHSVSQIVYLGLNEAGWMKFQLNPRIDNNDEAMAQAIQSICIDMANPDVDDDIQPKQSRLVKSDNNTSLIVEVEDLGLFLKHLHYCRCITEDDAKLISDAFNKQQKEPKHCSTPETTATTEHKQDSNDTNPLSSLVY